ncbi:hypothetical protein PMIN01_04880 [Paraphaeosphaeria minitans]|uniref:Uncharacterized protein n=1 Tax=Paraphaeosphaeria minitans TaxID=565426 RepID=A0A9P6GKV2_9PLEO|nr:hypothetical protein PMIN01_04880 [Paraphaeosphaeria minitans]
MAAHFLRCAGIDQESCLEVSMDRFAVYRARRQRRLERRRRPDGGHVLELIHILRSSDFNQL